MALLFCDSFDHYTQNDVLLKWTADFAGGFSGLIGPVPSTVNTAASSSFPGGGQIYNCASNSAGIYKTLPSSYATGVAGGWFWFGTLPDGNNHSLCLIDGTTMQVSVCGDGAGHLTVQRGGGTNSAGTVLATSANVVTTNTWYHIELKSTINNTTGVIQLKVNGTDWIASTSSLNTRASGSNQFTGFAPFTRNSTKSSDACKSVYILDTSGTVAKDFLGVCRVGALRPAAAGNYAQWTANSGANFAAAGDIFADKDTTFNGTATVNNIDSFSFTDVPTGATIHAVQHNILARQDGGATRQVAPLARISGTDYVGTAVNQAAGYVNYTEAQSLSPATSAQWTAAEVNAAEFGYKLIT